MSNWSDLPTMCLGLSALTEDHEQKFVSGPKLQMSLASSERTLVLKAKDQKVNCAFTRWVTRSFHGPLRDDGMADEGRVVGVP